MIPQQSRTFLPATLLDYNLPSRPSSFRFFNPKRVSIDSHHLQSSSTCEERRFDRPPITPSMSLVPPETRHDRSCRTPAAAPGFVLLLCLPAWAWIRFVSLQRARSCCLRFRCFICREWDKTNIERGEKRVNVVKLMGLLMSFFNGWLAGDCRSCQPHSRISPIGQTS